MSFRGIQKEFIYTQLNTGSISDVFPLLCPVMEAKWLDGWEYELIHSNSGTIEQDCVFTTPHHGTLSTVWYVSVYDSVKNTIEFIRTTPNESIVKIHIQLTSIDISTTSTHIKYQYTGLSEIQNEYINQSLEMEFLESMSWWEKAINYYLKNGKMLKKPS